MWTPTEDENFRRNNDRSTNPIWEYFLRHVNGAIAKCRKCGGILSIKGGNTGTMRNHMKLKHKLQVRLSAAYVNAKML